jgi:small subunit ribosomal protein S3
MGQKVHPYGFRLGIVRDWKSRWFFEREYAQLVVEDLRIRRAIERYCKRQNISGVADVIIRRKVTNAVALTIYTAKPGLLIGRKGTGIEALRAELEKTTGRQVHVAVEEVADPRLSAQLVAENIAGQIERRQNVRRAMKRSLLETMRAGAQGIKVTVSGRIGGAEIARRETQKEGKIPLSTLRALVDYGLAEARTPAGYIGVKVWICTDDGRSPQRAEPTVAQSLVGGLGHVNAQAS